MQSIKTIFKWVKIIKWRKTEEKYRKKKYNNNSDQTRVWCDSNECAHMLTSIGGVENPNPIHCNAAHYHIKPKFMAFKWNSVLLRTPHTHSHTLHSVRRTEAEQMLARNSQLPANGAKRRKEIAYNKMTIALYTAIGVRNAIEIECCRLFSSFSFAFWFHCAIRFLWFFWKVT